jgi:preprotein translocase subunit SecE
MRKATNPPAKAPAPIKATVSKVMDEDSRAPMVSPAQFVRNVRMEIGRTTFPTRKETTITTIMVFIMVVITAIFFFAVDQVLSWGVRMLLG